MTDRLIKIGLFISLFCLFGWGVISFTKLESCLTESLKDVHYILTLKKSFPFQNPIRRGDIVSIHGHKPQYVGDKPFAKRVMGLPGDKITQSKGKLKIETKNTASQITFSTTLPLLDKTKEGKPLTPLSVIIVPPGYVFVVGDHARSFDSRYEEFGLVSKDKIWGKALFAW